MPQYFLFTALYFSMIALFGALCTNSVMWITASLTAAAGQRVKRTTAAWAPFSGTQRVSFLWEWVTGWSYCNSLATQELQGWFLVLMQMFWRFWLQEVTQFLSSPFAVLVHYSCLFPYDAMSFCLSLKLHCREEREEVFLFPRALVHCPWVQCWWSKTFPRTATV